MTIFAVRNSETKEIVATFDNEEVAKKFIKSVDKSDELCDDGELEIDRNILSNEFYVVTDIEWDIDEEDREEIEDLPKKILIPNGVLKGSDTIDDAISDYLSDHYGYCHKGFKYNRVTETEK